MTPSSKFEHLQAAQRGDREALQAMCLQFERGLYGFLFRLTGNADDAFDLLQDTLMDMIAGVANLRNPESLRSWLYGIAYRNATDLLKQRGRFRPLEDEQEATTQEDASSLTLEFSAGAELRKVLSTLPTHHQAVITMHYMQSMSYDEIASTMNVSSGTVSSRLYYAKQALKQKLQG